MSSMMDIGKQLLAAIVENQDRQFLVNHVLREDLFIGDEIPVFNALMQHVMQYGVIPKRDTLQNHAVTLPEAPEPANYYYDRVLDRYMHRGLVTALESANDLLGKQDPNGALNLLNSKTSELWKLNNQQALMDLRESMPMFKQFVWNSFKGKKGIPVPWKYLDEMSGGLLGGDLIPIVGRPMMGKSWLILYWAWELWKLGYAPLVVSMEMKPLLMIKRLVSMAASLNMDHVKLGHIDDYEYGQILKLERRFQESEIPFHLVDGELISTSDDVLQQIGLLKPDVALIDGAYLLGHKNKRLGKYERVAEGTRDLKRGATIFDIPVIASYQLNRKGGKQAKGELDTIAYTDEIGQLGSLVLGLNQMETAANVNKKWVDVMKGRSGEVGKFPIHWDFIKTNFSQIEEDQLLEFMP